MLLAGPIIAAVIASAAPAWQQATPPTHAHRTHRTRRRHPLRLTPRRQSNRAALTLRRRIVRLESLAQLERREHQLHDFVVTARAETPLLADDAIYQVATGLSVGPSIVTRDFLGSPVVRARVHNMQQHAITVVLQAHFKSVNGRSASAAFAVSLQPNESRSIELLCPAAIVPSAIVWSATIL